MYFYIYLVICTLPVQERTCNRSQSPCMCTHMANKADSESDSDYSYFIIHLFFTNTLHVVYNYLSPLFSHCTCDPQCVVTRVFWFHV